MLALLTPLYRNTTRSTVLRMGIDRLFHSSHCNGLNTWATLPLSFLCWHLPSVAIPWALSHIISPQHWMSRWQYWPCFIHSTQYPDWNQINMLRYQQRVAYVVNVDVSSHLLFPTQVSNQLSFGVVKKWNIDVSLKWNENNTELFQSMLSKMSSMIIRVFSMHCEQCGCYV